MGRRLVGTHQRRQNDTAARAGVDVDVRIDTAWLMSLSLVRRSTAGARSGCARGSSPAFSILQPLGHYSTSLYCRSRFDIVAASLLKQASSGGWPDNHRVSYIHMLFSSLPYGCDDMAAELRCAKTRTSIIRARVWRPIQRRFAHVLDAAARLPLPTRRGDAPYPACYHRGFGIHLVRGELVIFRAPAFELFSNHDSSGIS